MLSSENKDIIIIIIKIDQFVYLDCVLTQYTSLCVPHFPILAVLFTRYSTVKNSTTTKIGLYLDDQIYTIFVGEALANILP